MPDAGNFPLDSSQARSSDITVLQARVAELEQQLQQAQAELQNTKAAHDRFCHLAQHINQTLFIIDAALEQHLYVSPNYEKFWGRSCESLYQDPQSWLEAVHPDDRVFVIGAMGEQLRGEPIQREYRIIKPDGSIRWMITQIVPIHDSTGQLIHFIGTAEDISDRKAGEIALHQLNTELDRRVQERTKELEASQAILRCQEQEIRTIVEHSPDVIVRFDRQLRHTYINSAIEAATGWLPEVYIGKTHQELGLPPEFVALWRQGLTQVFSTATETTISFQFFSPHGNFRYYYVKLVPEFDATGTVQSVLGIARDVTELKESEAALRRSEERFRTFFDNAPLPLSLADIHTRRIVRVNAAHRRLFGYTNEDLATKTFVDITAPGDATTNINLNAQMENGDLRQYEIEKQFVKKSGETFCSQMAVALIQDEQGNPLYSLAVIQDITAAKQLKAAQEQAEAALRESDRRLRAIFNQTFQFCGLLSPDGIALEANQTALDFAGFTAEAVIGKPAWKTPWFQHSDAAQEQLKAAIALARVGKFVRYEAIVQGHSHTLMTIDFSLKPLRNEQGEVELLIAEGRDISDRKRAEEERQRVQKILEEQAQRDQLLRSMTQQIHQSLNLNEILSITVNEVREVLQADRTVIFQLHNDGSGHIIQEAVRDRYTSIAGWYYPESHFPAYCHEKYLQGVPCILPDQEGDSRSNCLMEFLQQIQVESEIISPIIYVAESCERRLWGLLIVHACTHRQWEQSEADLLQQIANQLAIAIYQADLYTQVQTELAERKQVEANLRSSLQEKEILLKEVHHRVKNNLQIISSLLRMQSRQVNDRSTTILFQEAQNRVQSMAIIHEHLYQSTNLTQINFEYYLQTLLNNLFRSYGVHNQQILLDIVVAPINLSLNAAISCGLIINELVSNSLKYAFLSKQLGKITIHLSSDQTANSSEHRCRLVVGDDGIGIPPAINWQTTTSLGLRIVRNLVEQMRGTICIDRDRGTVFTITFPIFTH